MVLLLPLCRCNALLAACSCHADDLLAKKAALCRPQLCTVLESGGLPRLQVPVGLCSMVAPLSSALAFCLFQPLAWLLWQVAT